MKCSVTLFSYAHWSRAFEVNSVPLSMTIRTGRPRCCRSCPTLVLRAVPATRYRLRSPASPAYTHLQSTACVACGRRPMHPEENPSSMSRSSLLALPTSRAPWRRSDVSVCVCAPSASLPRRSGRPVCCSPSSLPAATEHVADDSPSGVDLLPGPASERADDRWLRQSASPADGSAT